MSYSKPVKQCVDGPLGFRAVNQLAQNQLDTKTVFEVEHQQLNTYATVGPPGTFVNLRLQHYQAQGGQHQTPKVSRGTMRVEVVTVVGADVVRVAARSGVCTELNPLGVGAYFLPLPGLSDFYAEVIPVGDVGATLIQQTPSWGGDGVGINTSSLPGIYISTWADADLGSGNHGFQLSHIPFFVVVYGRQLTPFNPGVEGFPWPSAQGRRPTQAARPRSSTPFVKL